MSFKSVKFKDTNINIIDGDRGENYPSQNEYLEDGYCLFLNAKNVTDSGFKFNKTKFISKEKDNILRKGRLKKEDVVLTTRGTVGNVGLFTHEVPYENIRINSGMLIFRLENRDEFLPEYIYWYFRSNLFQNQIKQYVSGSAQPQLPVKTINKMEILKPDIEIQKKIVKIISSVNKKVLNNNKMNKTLEEIAQAIYKNWFVYFEPFQDEEFFESELGMIPEGWEVGNINDFVNVQNGYGFSSKLFSDEGNIGVIKIKNITENNTVNISDTQYISKKTAEETNKRYLIKPNSILIAMTGAKVGKIGIVPETNTTLYLNQRVGMLKPKINGGIEYSYIALMTDYYQNVIKNKARGSAQANISATAIGSIKVVIPPKKILKKYANIIKPILNKISSNLNENRSLKELRDSLLPKLMSGEIRVPLDEDEKEVN
jgi:type I restriction enzyme S subunit